MNEQFTIGIESGAPSPTELSSSTNLVSSFSNNIFNADYLLQFLTIAGTQLGKMAVVLKELPNEMKDYVDDNFRDRAINILLSAGSLTAGYLVVRKLQQLYQQQQQKLKEIEVMERIDEDIKEQQKEVDYKRRQNPRNGQDKRELCILCISNRRECVFLDCGHICVCVDCLKSLPCPKTCPICRCKIIQTVLLFHA